MGDPPPDPPTRLQAWGWWLVDGPLQAAAVLVAVAWILVGGYDALLAARPQERLIGTVVLLSGLAAAGAVGLLALGRPGWALAGFIAGTVGGLLLAAVQIGFDHTGRTWLWLAMAVPSALLAAAAATLVRRGGSRLSDTVLAAVLATTATALVPLVGLVGGAFRPVGNAEILDSRVDLAVVAHRADERGARYAVVEATLTLENISRRRLVVFASNYTVTALRSRPRAADAASTWHLGRELAYQRWSGRYERPWQRHLVETGFDYFAVGQHLDPGQQSVSTFLFLVPAAAFNTVRARFIVATAFAERLRIGEQTERGDDRELRPDHPVRSTWHIRPTSVTAALTRGSPLLQVQHLVTADPPPYEPELSGDPGVFTGAWFDYRIGPDEERLRDADLLGSRMATFYGAGWSAATGTLAIDGAPR